MNGRQVSLAGHRFRAVVDPRIRGMDCADAAASDDLWTRYVRDGDATRSKATARVVPLGSQPTPARLADGFVRLVASPNGPVHILREDPSAIILAA